jgi:ABC-2 type transport system permease protein
MSTSQSAQQAAAAVPVRRQQYLLQWLRWRLLCNSARLLFSRGSLRPFSIVLACLLIAVFVFLVSWAGFRFLKVEMRLPLTGGIVGTLIDLLFLTLGLMLIFSTGLILYGSLFAAPESSFLLSKPFADDQIFAYKFQGAAGFSSWAFLLLGGPVLLAFGLVNGAPWYFYPLLLLFFLGFVLLPASLGALLCLLVVNWVPRQRMQLLITVVGLAAIGLGWWIWTLVSGDHPDTWDREAVNRLLGRFLFARSVLVPSHWVANGLQAAARGEVGLAGYFLALVWSNGLFLYLIAALVARRLYRRGVNRLATGGTIRRRHGGQWLDRIVAATLPFIDPRTRLLIVKDFRTFRRDPQQWGQVLIFSLLMVLYATNIRRMSENFMGWKFLNAISLLNLAVIALLLSIYTSRFIYPLLSLEGRKFWVLGLLPLTREQLLWGKFAFALSGCLLMSVLLTLLSDWTLGVPWQAVLLHLAAVIVLSAGLSGLSVGLGACMPNFREADPSKIAVGFGGTMNLIVSLVYLLLILVLMGAPWHIQIMFADNPDEARIWYLPVFLGVGVGLTLGFAAVMVPLRMGIKALRATEF